MPSETDSASHSSPRGGYREYGSSILIAVGLALLIRSTVVQAFYIPSGSMEDTLFVGDYLLANKFIYGAPVELPALDEPLFRLPGLLVTRQGDIVIFRSKTEVGRDLIKRCVAVVGRRFRCATSNSTSTAYCTSCRRWASGPTPGACRRRWAHATTTVRSKSPRITFS